MPAGGLHLGIAGAGIALCGAYVAMLAIMHLLTRRLFPVAFEWRRLAQLTAILAGVAVGGELLLPTHGFGGLALRVLVARARSRAAARHALLSPARARAGARARARTPAGASPPSARDHGDVEAYAEDPLRDL